MRGFNESEWIRLLFLLADTQCWLDDLNKQFFQHLPIDQKKKLFHKTYYLTPQSLAHIIERHYYKVPRYWQSGKFTISIIEIVHLIRDAASLQAIPVPGTLNFKRSMDAGQPVGYDRNGSQVTIITIITDAGGKIITAFPGSQNQSFTPGAKSQSFFL